MIFYGWLSYVQYVKKASDFLISYTVCIESPAIDVSASIGVTNLIIPIDDTFLQGKPPYGQDLSQSDLAHWYPDIYNQVEVLNSLVTVGPYIPKYNQTRNSTWELHFFMNFFLSGEVQKLQNHLLQTLHNNQSMMHSINSMQQYKLGTPGNKHMKALCTPGTTEGEFLKAQLLKEFKTTSQLKALSKKASRHIKNNELLAPVLQPPKKKTKKSRTVSRSSAKKVSRKHKKKQTSSSSSNTSENSSSSSSTTSSE